MKRGQAASVAERKHVGSNPAAFPTASFRPCKSSAFQLPQREEQARSDGAVPPLTYRQYARDMAGENVH
jgi:hypothetical protein